jgi:hypothetical protein
MLSENGTLGYADDALHELDELLERWEHRLTVDNLALAERYLKGELRLIADMEEIGGAGKKLRAALQGVCPVGWLDGYAEVLQPLPLPLDRQLDVQDHLLVGGPYRYDRLVFVQSVKLVDQPEWFAPAFVWFETVDETSGSPTDTLYLSHRVAFKFLSTIADRKPRLPSNLLSIREHQTVLSGLAPTQMDVASKAW